VEWRRLPASTNYCYVKQSPPRSRSKMHSWRDGCCDTSRLNQRCFLVLMNAPWQLAIERPKRLCEMLYRLHLIILKKLDGEARPGSRSRGVVSRRNVELFSFRH
jgi:hypothetical protein